MAYDDYTAKLPKPAQVTGSTAMQETTAAAVGEGLKGLAAIADVGLKYSADKRESRVLGAVEDSLAEQTKKFSGGGDQQPALLGEEGASNNPEDIGFSGDQWARIDRYRQGNAQGRISRAEFYAKTSAIVQQAIHDNPRFASSIRKRAQEVLGIAPTAAAVALEAEGQKAEEDIQRAAKTKLVELGLESGIGYMNQDGSFDVNRSVAATQTLLATRAYLKDYTATLEAHLKYKQLMAGPEAKPMTLAERQDIEFRTFTGGMEENGFIGSDTDFENLMGGFRSTIPAALAKNKNLSVPDQEQQIWQALDERRLLFFGQLNAQLNSNKGALSADTQEKIRKKYNDQFDDWKDFARGGYSNLQRNIDTMEQLKAGAQRDGWRVAPAYKRAEAIFGPQVTASIASVQLFTEAGTPGRQTIDRDTSNIVNYLQNVTKVAEGGLQTSQLPPDQQKGTMAGVSAGLRSTAKYLANGTSFDEKKDSKNFGNFLNDFVNSAAQSQNVKNLRGAVVNSADPDVIQSAIKLNSTDPSVAQVGGKGLMIVNAKAVALTGQSLIKDVVAAKNQLAFQNRESPGKEGQEWAVAYNAETGQYEVTNNITESNSMLAPLPMIPTEIAAKIRDMNNAMRANVQLAPTFGSDREKGMDEASLKMAYAQSTGLPIINGEVDNVTSSDNKSRIPDYPTGMVEPGNLDLITRKGIKNSDGTESVGSVFTRQDSDGSYVLVPQVVDGIKLSEDSAWRHYKMSGEHFGKFDTPEAAGKFGTEITGMMGEVSDRRNQIKKEKEASKDKNGKQIKVVNDETARRERLMSEGNQPSSIQSEGVPENGLIIKGNLPPEAAKKRKPTTYEFTEDGIRYEVLVPTVDAKGNPYPDAAQHYLDTGEFIGKFDTNDNAQKWLKSGGK